jgi:hypothetical protein
MHDAIVHRWHMNILLYSVRYAKENERNRYESMMRPVGRAGDGRMLADDAVHAIGSGDWHGLWRAHGPFYIPTRN